MRLEGWREWTGIWIGMAAAVLLAGAGDRALAQPIAAAADANPSEAVPAPPAPERVALAEVTLPPVTPSDRPGACSPAINPNGTGCMSADPSALQVGGFLPDGKHLAALVRFAGAPAGSPYPGEQLVLLKADGSRFSSGDSWKCLTCGLSSARTAGAAGQRDRPQVFRDGKRLLAGSTIYDCAPHALIDEACNGATIKAYPIHWQVLADNAGAGGAMRALRLHPDNEHIGFNASRVSDGRADQFAYIARLRFDRGGENRPARYVLDYVNLLFRPGIAERLVRPDPNRRGA
jgi:hypothetical protein